MRHIHALAAIVAGSLFAACIAAEAVSADNGPVTTMTIPMRALNGSGQNGTATLSAVGDKVSVTVHITGEAASASEPAHVHFGRCPIIKAVPAYNVGPVVGGSATNVVDLTWSEIISGKYVLNVHESTADLGRYVSCGNIGTSDTPMALPTDDSGGY